MKILRHQARISVRGQVRAGAFALLASAALAAVGFLTAAAGSDPVEHEITIRARKYSYDPPVIHVNRGDVLRLRFISEDVVHGFYLEGHDIDVTIVPQRSEVELKGPDGQSERVEEVVFTANREGKFRYRCSATCGFLHPFMLGELIVGPNRLLRAGIGAAVGLLLGITVFAWRGGGAP